MREYRFHDPALARIAAMAARQRARMSAQSYVETLFIAGVDGPALTASTTATSLLGVAVGQQKYTLPTQFFDRISKCLRITATGRITTVVTTPGTLTLDVRFGSVIVFNGGAMSLNIVAKTNVTWELVVHLAARAIGGGTTANLMGVGKWTSEAVIGSSVPTVGGSGVLLLPASAPAVGTGFDSTAAQTIDLFGTWSINNADSILVHQFKVESLN